MKTDDIGSGNGNVTVGENATLNIDLECDSASQTYGIFAKGNVALNGTVDIKWNIRARVRLATRGKTYLRMLRTQPARSERMQNHFRMPRKFGLVADRVSTCCQRR